MEWTGGRYVIRGGGRNPTFVNGKPVPAAGRPLVLQDVVRLGDWVGVVVESDLYGGERLNAIKRCFSLAPESGYPFWQLSPGAELFGGPAFARSLVPAKHAAKAAEQEPARVLIEGQTGVGKEQIARAMHAWSGRPSERYIPVACGTLESGTGPDQLFGHARGAFTGADRETIGYVQEADSGTLVLDDIDQLRLDLQGLLHRTLQENTVIRLGEPKPKKVNLLAISTSSIPLRELVERGRFRADLLGRIAEFHVPVTPLRGRREDVVPLFSYFYRSFAQSALHCDAHFAEHLCLFDWPLNVRNLRAIARRLSTTGARVTLKVTDLHPQLEQESVPAPGSGGAEAVSTVSLGGSGDMEPLSSREELVERAMALAKTRDVLAAAAVLGISAEDAYRGLRDELKSFARTERRGAGDWRVALLLRAAVEGVMDRVSEGDRLTPAARASGFPDSSTFHNTLKEYEKLGPEEERRAAAFRQARKASRSSAPPSSDHGA